MLTYSFLYTQLSFVFLLQKDSDFDHDDTDVFFSSERFWYLSRAFFCPFFFSFRKILISLMCFFSKLFFVFFYNICSPFLYIQNSNNDNNNNNNDNNNNNNDSNKNNNNSNNKNKIKRFLLAFIYKEKNYQKYFEIKIKIRNCVKSLEFVLNTIFFVPKSFQKYFHEYVRTENLSHKIAWNYLKNSWIVFINFSKDFCEYIRMENPSYKIAWSHLKITWNVLYTIFFNLKIFQKIFGNI